jgi:C-terminal processing protease CtpA/Prc
MALALSALALAAAAAPVDAQQTNDDCRCVDANGNAIADCTCFRTPSFDRMAFTAVGFGRPRLGVSVSADQGDELDAQGAQVTRVLEDGPAWTAGIREGDIITAIDGQSLFETLPGNREDDFDLDRSIPVQRLLAIARELEPGQEVEVTYLRNGEERSANLTAADLANTVPGFDAERFRTQLRDLSQVVPRMRWQGAAPGDPDVRFFDRPSGALFFDGARFGRYGLELVDMNAGLGQYFGTEQGVLVVDVADDSTLGLEPGDVILRIGDRDAQTSERVLRILSSYGPGEEIPIEIRRDGRQISVLGRVEG